MKKFILGVLFTFPNFLSGQGHLTGDWGGARTTLSDAGVEFEFVYTAEYLTVFEHNLEDGSVYLDNIDITATLNFDKLIDWNGATLFGYVLGNNGGIPNERVGTIGRSGAIQGISNIAT